MPRLLPFLALASLAACNSAPPVLRPIPEIHHGTYRFTDRINTASPMIVVEGEFTVRADTIFASVTTGNCQPVLPPSTQAYNIRCGQVQLSFDRRNPLQRAGYSVQGTAMVPQRVCVRFVPNSSGQQVCVQYGTETVQVVRQFTGTIRPIPTSP